MEAFLSRTNAAVTNEEVLDVVARKQWKHKWKMLVHAPNAARGTLLLLLLSVLLLFRVVRLLLLLLKLRTLLLPPLFRLLLRLHVLAFLL